jgi:di/tricarboxylate transporter
VQFLPRTGTKDKGLIAGFMLATGFMSMWISNTATTIMMLPLEHPHSSRDNWLFQRNLDF